MKIYYSATCAERDWGSDPIGFFVDVVVSRESLFHSCKQRSFFNIVN